MRSYKQILPLICVIIVLAIAIVAVQLYSPQNKPGAGVQTGVPEQPADPQPPENENPPVNPNPPENDDPPINPNPPENDDPPVNPNPPQPAAPIVSLSGVYYTYDEMAADMEALAQRYPDALTYRSYGTSVDGRDLLAATLGNPKAPRQIIITAGMHAREYVNPYVIMRQLEYYLEGYDTIRYRGQTPRQLFEAVCLIVVPMTNPDGLTLAQEGIGSIRNSDLRQKVTAICNGKGIFGEAAINAYLNKFWKANAIGVDLNRNFDAWWATHQDGVGEPAEKNYKGDAPHSALEVASLVALTKSLTNPVASVCVHSQGKLIYWRGSQTGTFEAENRALAQLAQSVTKYQLNSENQTEPSYSNWTILQGIPSITIETGLYSYPQSHVAMEAGIFAENRDVWAAVAYAYADGTAIEPMG